MKIGYLLGACGLAATSVVSANTANAAQPGTPEFRRMVDESRTLLREGRLELRTLTHINPAEDMIPMSGGGATASSSTRSHFITESWGALIDGDDFALDFEEALYQITTLDPTAGNPFIPLRGHVHTNGNPWQGNGGSGYTGVTNNALAQSGPRFDPDGADNDPLTEGPLEGDPDQHGEVGGPDPLGTHGQFAQAAAGTIATQPFSFGSRLEGWLRHTFYAPVGDDSLVTIVDMYHDRVDAGMWWSPLSQTEGNFFVISSFWFGYTFSTFAPLADADGVIRRPLILGPRPGDPNRGNFFVPPAASPWDAKTDEWFSVGLRQRADSYSIWVRDSQTIGTNGFVQNSIYDGLTGGADPSNTKGAFAGEIFENDWLQILPGLDDDPGTAGVIEGYGTSANDFGQPSVLQVDSTGASVGLPFNAAGIDTIHWRGGFDPSLTNAPLWTPSDHFIDNYVVLGTPFPLPDPRPDFTIPFKDDLELWSEGELRLQGDDWFVTLLQNPTVHVGVNNTAGGSQSIRQIGTFLNNVYQSSFARRVLPPVTARVLADGITQDPAIVQSSIRISDNFLSRGYVALDNVDNDVNFSHIILGGRDSNFLVDNFIYARQANPSFDPTVPQTDQSGTNVIDNGTDNVPFVNVRLTDAGGTPLTVPTNSFFDVHVEVEFDAGGNHPVLPSFDFGAGFVNAVPDPSAAAFANPRGLASLTTPTPTTNRQEWFSGGEVGGFLNTIFVDDICVDGPRAPRQYIQEVEDTSADGPYIDDPSTTPGFNLPYNDDFSSYDVGDVLDDHGWTPFLNTVFSDQNGELDIIDVLAAPVIGVTQVFEYRIADSIQGTLPGGPYANGTIVAVVDNLPPFFDASLPPTIPGSFDLESRVNYRDSNRIRQAAADWELQDNDGDNLTPVIAKTWDGASTVVGRYQFQYDARVQASDGQNVTADDPTASGRGNVAALNSLISGDAVSGDTDFVFSSRLPVASALGGSNARLEFDLWVGDGINAVNSGRTIWSLQGIGVNREPIAEVVFGGPNNFEDLVTFDSDTGVVTLGVPDGLADTFQFNDFQSSPTNIYLRAGNPDPLSTEDFVWVNTGDLAPVNTWVRCTALIFNNGDWEITIDDGLRAPLNYNGVSLTTVVASGSNVSGTDTIQIQFGNDETAGGSPQLAPLEWYSLGQSAAPEGGLDFLSEAAGPGSFNPFSPGDAGTYFYYSTGNILPPSLNLPQITDVFGGDGSIVGARDLGEDDRLIFWNNELTAGVGGANTPLNDSRTPRVNGLAGAVRYNFLDELALDGDPTNDSDVLARGFMTALGTPGDAGVASPAQLGGVVNFTPPYGGDIPFDDILMGTLVGYAPPATTSTPVHVSYVDNIFLDVDSGCLTDLDGDGDTDGTDLLILLGGWNNPGLTDLNGDGTTSGIDLLELLGAWDPLGICVP